MTVMAQFPAEPMFCPECRKQGLKSRVYVGYGSSTALFTSQFYDEEGRYHFHDPNIHSTSYRCSNEHHWRKALEQTCWCGWPGVPKKAEPEPVPGPKGLCTAVRYSEGHVDDVVIDCDSIHLEQMDTGKWWMAVYRGKERVAFNIWRQGKDIVVRVTEDALGCVDDTPKPTSPESPPATRGAAEIREQLVNLLVSWAATDLRQVDDFNRNYFNRKKKMEPISTQATALYAELQAAELRETADLERRGDESSPG